MTSSIEFVDLTGSPQEIEWRNTVRSLLQHHGITNGVLVADLVSAILAKAKSPVEPCAICGGPFDNDLLTDICIQCETEAPWEIWRERKWLNNSIKNSNG